MAEGLDKLREFHVSLERMIVEAHRDMKDLEADIQNGLSRRPKRTRVYRNLGIETNSPPQLAYTALLMARNSLYGSFPQLREESKTDKDHQINYGL